jgi:hypothetical protein
MNTFQISFVDAVTERQVEISVKHTETEEEMNKRFTAWYFSLRRLPEDPSKAFKEFLNLNY